jgi:hypothetical protein
MGTFIKGIGMGKYCYSLFSDGTLVYNDAESLFSKMKIQIKSGIDFKYIHHFWQEKGEHGHEVEIDLIKYDNGGELKMTNTDQSTFHGCSTFIAINVKDIDVLDGKFTISYQDGSLGVHP